MHASNIGNINCLRLEVQTVHKIVYCVLKMNWVNNRNMSLHSVNTHHAAKTKYVRNTIYTPEISKVRDVG